MLQSYIKIAIRNLFKNRLYAAINIIGLSIGLAVFLLSTIIVDYERNHDHMFANRDQIFTVSTVYDPSANQGSAESRGVHLAMKPLAEAQMPELTGVSRRMMFETLMRIEDASFYQDIHFVDPDFTKMFDFSYIYGTAESLTGPSQIVVTDEMAEKYFGRVDVVGETIRLVSQSSENPMQIVAVIESLPADTHFNSVIGSDERLGIFALVDTIDLITDTLNPNENWSHLSSDFMLYVMTDGTVSQDKLDRDLTMVFNENAPVSENEFVASLKARPLKDANLSVWYTTGVPVVETMEILGIVVLAIAIINYANLATAQNMGRFREVGMRKALGASRRQLLIQFFLECQSIVVLAMIVSLAIIEMVIPFFNESLGRVVAVDYVTILPLLIGTTVGVGLLAGVYPAILITRATPSDALRNLMQMGNRGALFRTIMIGTQFTLSIIMMALVLVVYIQNGKVLKDSEIFPKSQVVNIQRIDNDAIMERMDTFMTEVEKLPDVEYVALSSQVPYRQQNWTWDVTSVKGDMENKIGVNSMNVSHDFMTLYQIPIVAGRDFSRDVSADETKAGATGANVLINEMAAQNLGYATPEDAIGQTFYSANDDSYMLRIIGVTENRNILGLQNHLKPFVFRIRNLGYRHVSVRLREGANASTLNDLEDIWREINPDFPYVWDFLDAEFEDNFSMMRSVNMAIAGFAAVAVSLALFGLFGLAAFQAEQRTREIGIRKVLGAGLKNIVPMLLIQFSKPAMWAALVAVPAAYYASDQYLAYFADRIAGVVPLIMGAGFVAVLLAWVTIAVHAFKVARQNPIKALRYE
ncbi:ABC transporter permease [Kordiimonas sediminis]|uniref:ABC transporter permease n=1 Tax=Kordiimonas sediminis TaxID=1735581 RepID=A0A919AQT0_9PROT|nr:ABC transporter permease [Kordiimonas sediminis]GHF19955.1 ABC transporter permease [Kordiimonas sediminis]